MIMELVLRDSMKSWNIRKLAWSPEDFVLATICCADNCCCAGDGGRGN